MEDHTLPSVEECQEFLRAINEGRALVGLDPLEKLDYDSCWPADGARCLSATHLYGPAGYDVGCHHAWPMGHANHALATHSTVGAEGELLIPPAIKVVTDVFDSATTEMQRALRWRMVEAGVVDP